jgi:transposase
MTNYPTNLSNDILGLILAIVIQSASVQDRNGGIEVVAKLVENWKKIVRIFADGGYNGTLIDKIRDRFKIIVEIIKRDESHKFKVLPKKWIVERTFA